MKNKSWLIALFFALCVFLLCFSLDFVEVYEKANFTMLWFVSMLFFLGFFLLVRALQYKIDSNLLMGILFISIAITLLVYEIFKINFMLVWPFFIFGLVVGHFVTFLFFKDKLHLKFMLATAGLFIISILFAFSVFSFVWFIMLIIFWLFIMFISYFVINNRGGAL